MPTGLPVVRGSQLILEQAGRGDSGEYVCWDTRGEGGQQSQQVDTSPSSHQSPL